MARSASGAKGQHIIRGRWQSGRRLLALSLFSAVPAWAAADDSVYRLGNGDKIRVTVFVKWCLAGWP